MIGPCDSIVKGTCFVDEGCEVATCSAEEVGFSMAWEEAYRLACWTYISDTAIVLGARQDRSVRGTSRRAMAKGKTDETRDRRGVWGWGSNLLSLTLDADLIASSPGKKVDEPSAE